ncbi:hypothetical protein XENOCAPTIV_008950 [Xenoophorus captivus]|uniref:Uncharacterized protein n=1 Tax=Xenoophorus captivus TaxID=1517983 RepID=A0ABV0S5Y5_9TELE
MSGVCVGFNLGHYFLFWSGNDDEGEKDSLTTLGEGGDTGELVPGKSLVYAAMELLVFILVRHLPQLNSRVKESPSHAPLRPQRLPDESARLVANAVSILAELPSLCSPAGVQLLALLVPTLISYLLDENAISSAPQVSRNLHDFALQNLMRIGPLYPAAFKTVISAAPDLKTRLESAIRANQASNKAKAAARQAQPTVQAAPTIKLKTSFF